MRTRGTLVALGVALVAMTGCHNSLTDVVVGLEADCTAESEIRICMECIGGTFHRVELQRHSCVGSDGTTWEDWRPIGRPVDTGMPCPGNGGTLTGGTILMVDPDEDLVLGLIEVEVDGQRFYVREVEVAAEGDRRQH